MQGGIFLLDLQTFCVHLNQKSPPSPIFDFRAIFKTSLVTFHYEKLAMQKLETNFSKK